MACCGAKKKKNDGTKLQPPPEQNQENYQQLQEIQPNKQSIVAQSIILSSNNDQNVSKIAFQPPPIMIEDGQSVVINQPVQHQAKSVMAEIKDEEEEKVQSQIIEDEQSKLVQISKQRSNQFTKSIQESHLRKQIAPVYQQFKQSDVDGPYVQNTSHHQQSQKSAIMKPLFEISQSFMVAKIEDITQKIFFAKGINNCCTYKLFLQCQRFMLKSFVNCQDGTTERIMNTFKKYFSLEHANIRKIKGFIIEKGQIQSTIGVVSEYFNHNIYSFAAQNTISLNDRFKVAGDILRAVIFLHTNNVILGNLKPSNILVTLNNDKYQGVITDWELQYTNESEFQRKRQGLMPIYTAPELYKNMSKECLPASDVWSLGYIFFLLFFQIDLAVEKHRMGLVGKTDITYFAKYDVYSREFLEYDTNLIILPVFMEGFSRPQILQIFQLIQKMTYKDPSKRINISQIQSQLDVLINANQFVNGNIFTNPK